MRSTLIDIAREAGVSAATVDRVLNNRAGVRSRTREIVIETAAAARLHLRRGRLRRDAVDGATLRLDFVLPVGTNTFIKMLQQQLQLQGAARPGSRRRRSTRSKASIPIRWPATLQDLRGRTQGVGVIALDHPTVREAIRALSASGVKVVTLASDILHVPRVAYVGIDNRAAGRLAGYVLGRFLGTAEPQEGRAVRRLAVLSRP